MESRYGLCNVQRRGEFGCWRIEMKRNLDRRPDHIDDRWSGAGKFQEGNQIQTSSYTAICRTWFMGIGRKRYYVQNAVSKRLPDTSQEGAYRDCTQGVHANEAPFHCLCDVKGRRVSDA